LIKVFISYSHDSDGHMDRVLGLSDQLRADGIDCSIDQYETSPPGGWARWTRNQITEADYVIVVCTETYRRRYEVAGEEGAGAGAKWEGGIITQQLYESQGGAHKFIPVIFSADDGKHIPVELRGQTYYLLDGERGYESLYRRITNQPEVIKRRLGELKSLPTRRRKSDTVAEKTVPDVQDEPPKKTVMPDDEEGRDSGGGAESFNLNPMRILRESIRAVPAVKYALGIAGVISAVAIIASLAVDLRVALFGGIIMIILMTLLVIFAHLTTTAPRYFLAPALFLTWSSLILTVTAAALLFTSVFFGWPVDLKYVLHPAPAPETGLEKPGKDAATTPTPSLSPAGSVTQAPKSTPARGAKPTPTVSPENDSLNLLNRREAAENALNKANTNPKR
jgi:hypothetical protein